MRSHAELIIRHEEAQQGFTEHPVVAELDTPRVAMFGVQHGEGAVMLSYNSTYTRSITNSPCTPPAPCTLDSISHSGTSPMHMCILLCAAL